MPTIDLKYGDASIPFEYDASQFEILGANDATPALTDAELNGKLDHPIGTPVLEEIVAPGQTVLIVVPDATRATAAGQVVNLVVRRLIANGTAPHEIRIIFATGIHRKVTEEEKAAILTPFIAQRIKTLDHDPRDLMQLRNLGITSGGIPIELDRALVEHDHVILVGGVTFHYFAGFTGGRKLVCPGLGSSRTIAETHKLAFDCEAGARRAGVDTGILDGNAVNDAFMECVEKVRPGFCISTIVNDRGEATALFCGDWKDSHRAACDAYAADHTVRVSERRPLVIASCGGFPHDINMVQAHKTLDAAARACEDGGTVVLIAECRDGLGRKDFLDWFDHADSAALASALCRKYQVNGQTAWSLLTKTERFNVRMLTSIPANTLKQLRIDPISPEQLPTLTNRPAYIIPTGSKIAVIHEEFPHHG